MQLFELVKFCDVPDTHFDAVGVDHIEETVCGVVLHLLVDDEDRCFALCELTAELSIVTYTTNFWHACRPLELRIGNVNWPRLPLVLVNVSKRELKLTCRQNVDRLGREDDEWVDHCKALGHQLDALVSWFLKLDRNRGVTGLHRPQEEVVSVVKVARARVWRRELLDNVRTLRDRPIEAKAVHRAEDVLIVVVACYCDVLITVHAKLLLACEDLQAMH